MFESSLKRVRERPKWKETTHWTLFKRTSANPTRKTNIRSWLKLFLWNRVRRRPNFFVPKSFIKKFPKVVLESWHPSLARCDSRGSVL